MYHNMPGQAKCTRRVRLQSLRSSTCRTDCTVRGIPHLLESDNQSDFRFLLSYTKGEVFSCALAALKRHGLNHCLECACAHMLHAC